MFRFDGFAWAQCSSGAAAIVNIGKRINARDILVRFFELIFVFYFFLFSLKNFPLYFLLIKNQ
jgi:hypothetical protein